MLCENFMENFQAIVLEAGNLIVHAEDIAVAKEKEGTFNFVTKYDTMVQDYLIRKLKLLLPEASFLGEENGQSSDPMTEPYCFIIDPIDGTTNFLCHFQCSAISVALSCHGKVTHGIVYNPFRKELFSAEVGKGAFLNGRPICVSDKALCDGVFIFGTTPYNPELRDSAFALAKDISSLTMDLRELGAASICLCYVACGRAVAYASPRLCTWDYAAASIILTEAGCALTDFDGSPLDFRTKVPVVASTPTGLKQFLAVSQKYAGHFSTH